MVKINIAYPPYGSNQLIEVDDERKWRVFLDKRLSEEVPADSLGDEFKGYIFKITGGYDKEGFAMMQGVMINHRTRLLLDGRTGQYTPKRHGSRKRKSVRGCIIGTDMSSINVIIVKRGPTDLPKLTDKASDRPSVRGPKRAANIRKAWGLTKKDDVRQYVVKRVKPGKDGKRDRIKSPKNSAFNYPSC
jgi:small subunit ribosomal protein S6e